MTAKPPIDAYSKDWGKCPPLGGQQRLGLRPAQTGFEHRGHRLAIHRDQPVHPHQVQTHHAVEAIPVRDQTAHDGGSTPERNQGHVLAHAPGEQRLDLRSAAGTHHHVG